MSTQGRGAYSRTLTRTTEPIRFIGLMSGTSMDGVDGVVLRCEGPRLQVTHARHTVMPDALRHTLLNLNTSGPDELRRSALAANELVMLCAQTVHGLLLPNAALQRQAGQSGVWRLGADGKPAWVPVKVGAAGLDGTVRVDAEGLAEGDRVVQHSQKPVQAGMRLQVVDALVPAAAPGSAK